MLESITHTIAHNEPVLLFLSTHEENSNEPLLCFSNPHAVVTTTSYDQIFSKLEELDRWVNAGYWVAGFISYEAGYAFEKFRFTKPEISLPLIWFGVFDKPLSVPYNPPQTLQWLDDCAKTYPYQLSDFSDNLSKDEYIQAITKIKNYLSEGDIYQANFTFRHYFNLSGSAFGLFCNLQQSQNVGYGAYISLPEHSIISLSPELFFKTNGREITVKPMKGTSQRGLWYKQDIALKRKLSTCRKNQAENVMIVDLLRNDLGKICESGSIIPSKIFETVRYETLFQMISTVDGTLRKDCQYSDIFRHIFPSGSVIGAPKIRAMEIIRELEKAPRGIYTGSIGYISPDGNAQFNVAIRTIHVDKQNSNATLGIGSGIVADSEPIEEYKECFLKSSFITKPQEKFSIIETMLWENDEIFLEQYHWNRLEQSAEYFGFHYDKNELLDKLNQATADFDRLSRYKIRLLIDKFNNIKIESIKIKVNQELDNKILTISKIKTTTKNRFLYHKTTIRDLYTTEHQSCRQEGFYDVIFMNEHGHITEGAISNVFIKKDGRYITPPVSSGLLNGTYRQFFIDTHPENVSEQNITLDDLFHADVLYLTNSVAGMVEVTLLHQKQTICD